MITPRGRTAALLALVSMASVSAAVAGDLDKVVHFDIKAETLNAALLQYGVQAHVGISFESTPGSRKPRAEQLKGDYTGREALARLLRGTELRFVERGHTIAIVSSGQQRASRRIAAVNETDPPEAQVPDERRASEEGVGGKAESRAEKKTPPALQEVIVTGTHISGAPPQSTPMITFTSQEMEDSGYPTIEQFMQSIPQNYAAVGSGGQTLNEDSLAGNVGFGTGVDIRGLGYDSTLVLVDGHRMAPAGDQGGFTDISVIPISAIDRIEILTDGASAIYGSDAVGGVVNYILKSDESGANTTLQYGEVTSGGLKDFRAGQSIGGDWAGGGGLLSYEYHDESPLAAADRTYSRSVPGQDLLPEARQNSVFGTLHQEATDDLELGGDAFFADRHNSAALGTFILQPEDAETREYQVTLDADWRLKSAWHVDATAGYGGNTTKETVPGALEGANSTLAIADLTANGPLLTLPGGPIRVAIGSELRSTRLSQSLTGSVAYIPEINRGRTVGSAYAEVRVPLVGARNDMGTDRVPVLELDAAGRYEHYTDFGSSTNPQVGLAWSPIGGLRLRGTWSSSFAAPELWETNSARFAYLFNSPDPLSPTGSSAVLILYGGNPRLGAETSTQWTGGVDLMPAMIRGSRVSVNYYRINYDNRINIPGIPEFAALAQGDQYSGFIERNPSPALIAQLSSPPYLFTNATLLPYPGYGPPRALMDAVAVADNELQNIGRTVTDGVDLTAGYAGTRLGWRYHAGINGTYVLDYQETDISGGPTRSVLSTLGNPINFRARASGGIGKGAIELAMAVNYYKSYVDKTVPAQPVPIASWTTVDVQGRYNLFQNGVNEALKNIAVVLSCGNCLNRNPPHVEPSSDPLERGYDPENANPLGRFISLSLEKAW